MPQKNQIIIKTNPVLVLDRTYLDKARFKQQLQPVQSATDVFSLHSQPPPASTYIGQGRAKGKMWILLNRPRQGPPHNNLTKKLTRRQVRKPWQQRRLNQRMAAKEEDFLLFPKASHPYVLPVKEGPHLTA
jgi:hypothetical protein